jgi:protein-disulfide isomerase
VWEAACYACVAGYVGKYDPVADPLFATQNAWEQTGKVEEVVTKVLTEAEMKRVRALAKPPGILAEVDRETQKARDMKVHSMPTMIVMHKSKSYLSPAVSYPFRRFIDQLLTQ